MARKIKVSRAEYKYEVWDMMYDMLNLDSHELEEIVINRSFSNDRLTHVETHDLMTNIKKSYEQEMERLVKKWDIDIHVPQRNFPSIEAAD